MGVNSLNMGNKIIMSNSEFTAYALQKQRVRKEKEWIKSEHERIRIDKEILKQQAARKDEDRHLSLSDYRWLRDHPKP